MSTEDWIERVRQASDLAEIAGQTITLKRAGRNLMGLCPFHSEKTPSFSVHPERQFYHCFSCKAGGDVFKFVQEIEKIGFLEAVELLSRRAGIPVPERRGGVGGQRGRLVDSLSEAAAAYETWLSDPRLGESARGYLEDRGISRETQRAFRLGVVPPGWDHLTRRLAGRFPEEVLVQAGLVSRKDGGRGLYDRFRNRILIPLIQVGGEVVGFGARALEAGDEPKYLNSPETAVYHKSSFLYGLDRARRHVQPGGEVIVVEGYFDVMVLHQAGLANTVATSGTALTPDHAKALRRMTNRIALTYDGDSAGREAVVRSLGTLLAGGLDVVVVDLPAGEDPDSLVRKGGVPAWESVRNRAGDPVAFLERHMIRTGGAADAREAAVQAAVRLAAEVSDPVRSRLLVERASEVFGLSADVLARAVSLRQSGQVSEQPARAAVRAQRSGDRELEEQVLRALLIEPEARDRVRDRIGPEDFRDPVCRSAAEWWWSGARGAPEDEAAAILVRELSLAPPGTYDWQEEVRGGTRALTMRRLKTQRKEAQEALRQTASDAEQRVLLETVGRLSRQIEDLERNVRDFVV
jgi:DNA primase